MAEAFAKAYGAGVLEAYSAGLAPALAAAPLTYAVLLEKNIDLGDFYPKEIHRVLTQDSPSMDLIVNMSGYELQMNTPMKVEDWDVRDPIGESEEVFREVRDDIERRVVALIQRLRPREAAPAVVSTRELTV